MERREYPNRLTVTPKERQISGTVQFGSEITRNGHGKSWAIVTDVDPETRTIAASNIVEKGKGQALGFPGTTSVEDITAIGGTWPLEKIIKAFELGWGTKLSEKSVSELREKAKKPPFSFTPEDE